jgi:hypothetical protein
LELRTWIFLAVDAGAIIAVEIGWQSLLAALQRSGAIELISAL